DQHDHRDVSDHLPEKFPHVDRDWKCHLGKIECCDEGAVARNSFRSGHNGRDGESVHEDTDNEVSDEIFDATTGAKHDPKDKKICSSQKDWINYQPNPTEIVIGGLTSNARA